MMIGEQFRQACGDLLRKPPCMVRQFSGQQRFVQWQVHRQRRGIGAADRDPPSSDTAFVDIEAEDQGHDRAQRAVENQPKRAAGPHADRGQ